MNRWVRLIPVFVVVLATCWVASKARMPQPEAGEMNLEAFGKLPVVFHGRVKPFDTLARNSLVVVSDKQEFKDADGEKQPAIRWLLDVITRSEGADDHEVFRIHNLDLIESLGLEEKSGSFRYALSEFRDKTPIVFEQARSASDKPTIQQDAYERSVMTLANHLAFYEDLRHAHEEPREPYERWLRSLEHRMEDPRYQERLVHAVAPLSEGASPDAWESYTFAAAKMAAQGTPNVSLGALRQIFHAYHRGDVTEFNRGVEQYGALVADAHLQGSEKLGFEYFFNHFSPFYLASVLYVFTFLLGVFSWIGLREPLRQSALALILFTFVLHTAGLASRIYITGYPPVTNLYSSAIFIGWGCILLGIIIEFIFKIGVGNLVASVLGFTTLLIAHFLSLQEGETMEMMQAVLDTKFWLATHVVTITFGYTATYFAGGVAIVYILMRLIVGVDKEFDRILARIMYGTICFALLLSFVGTVLGGLWADDSWGRFWGWDPKENGALIIVLWNALILHARWGGMVKTRGIAVLAVFGNIVTSWSWFGVNQLSVGLHAYGFMDSAVFWLVAFVLSQLVVMGLGLIPVPHARAVAANEPTSGKKPKSASSPTGLPGDSATPATGTSGG